MEFIKWMMTDMLMDAVTWIAAVAVLISWGLGVAHIVKYGWNPKEEVE